MVTKPNANAGKFIYALAEAGEGDQIYQVRGLNKSTVYAITEGNVAAVVSDIHSPRVRPERRNLMAHRAVLQHLMDAGSLLPMRFGVIAASAPAVRNLLATNAGAIGEQMERVAGRLEMGLRVFWDVGNIYEYFVGNHPMLRTARDRMLAEGDGGGREARIELGRLYEHLISEERRQHTERVVEVLRDYCEEIVDSPPKKEKEVMNLACLVGREAMAGFEKGVIEASRPFDSTYLFDYTGPWAPHNFVDLDLHNRPAQANA